MTVESKRLCAIWVVSFLVCSPRAAKSGARAATVVSRVPVVVELFTSEGCSTCPPADALLERLEKSQPVAGAQIIAMSEHVDYWNHGGWKDPFSSALVTRRQEDYDRRFGISAPYTPQMVVDGRVTFNGSIGMEAVSAIRSAVRGPKLAVKITASQKPGWVNISVAPAGAGFAGIRSAEVYAAVTQDSGSSNVLRGENRGHLLHYVSIVRKLRQIGSMNPESGFHRQVSSGLASGQFLIAFVQQSEGGKLLGAAVYQAPN
jgi:hypothetical protein